jgi:hypothetical protein
MACQRGSKKLNPYGPSVSFERLRWRARIGIERTEMKHDLDASKRYRGRAREMRCDESAIC